MRNISKNETKIFHEVNEVKLERKDFDVMMPFSLVRARSALTQLEVFDNRLFFIYIELLAGTAFRVYFTDLLEGNRYVVSYKDREEFNREWKIVDKDDEEFVKYNIINYYME